LSEKREDNPMKNLVKFIFFSIFFITTLAAMTAVNAADVETLLRDGKATIERGEYEKAVDYLGKILEMSGNQTNDPKIVAFGATVQAYGIWKMNNAEMKPMVIQNLNKAIANDPKWEYPKKLLKEIEGE